MINSKEELLNEQSHPSFQQKIIQGVKIIIAVGGIALWGFGIYKGVEQAHIGQVVYDEYEKNCQIHLQRAGSAGTAAPARAELSLAMPWLESHYAIDSFEKRELKASLQYLQLQEPALVVPSSINNSIRQNSLTIDDVQLAMVHDSGSLLFLMLILPLFVALILAGLYFMEFGRFYL